MMNSILLKGNSSSTASNSRPEQADPVPTIRLLTDKYGLTKGSEYVVMSETPSRIHYLLEGGQHCVHKDHEGMFWDWATRGPVPTGGRVGSRSSMQQQQQQRIRWEAKA